MNIQSICKCLQVGLFLITSTSPAIAQSYIGIYKDNLYIKGLNPQGNYEAQQEGVIYSRSVVADECGIITLRNSSKYPIIANGNYFDIYFQQQDYWYYWTTYSDPQTYPKLKCNKVGADFVVSGNIYQALDGTGSQSFVVFPDMVQIYHPAIIAPFSQHTITWYGEWMGSNYQGNTKDKSIKVNTCGVGKLNLEQFKQSVWDFSPGEFTFTLKNNDISQGTFDPAQQEIMRSPVCKNGTLFEPTNYL
jgi:hypothetical protein